MLKAYVGVFQESGRSWDTLGIAALLLVSLPLLSTLGCASKDDAITGSKPGAAGAAAGGGPKAPTAEQEAAKQRAIQQAPAIEAALRQAQGK